MKRIRAKRMGSWWRTKKKEIMSERRAMVGDCWGAREDNGIDAFGILKD